MAIPRERPVPFPPPLIGQTNDTTQRKRAQLRQRISRSPTKETGAIWRELMRNGKPEKEANNERGMESIGPSSYVQAK